MLSLCSIIKRNPESYDRVHEILGLPENVHWSTLKVEFGNNDVATVTLTLLPTGEQVRDLAELAIQSLSDDCVMPSEDQLEDALLASADNRPHSRACGLLLHPHGPECAVDCPTCRT
jgi:hypothetical protein